MNSKAIRSFGFAVFLGSVGVRAESAHSAAQVDSGTDVTKLDDCFTTGATPHVCVLMRLAQFESAYETDLEKLVKEFGDAASNPKSKSALLSNPVFLNRLSAISAKYDRVATKFRKDIIEMAHKKKSTSLELIANFELPRLQADLQSRLSIMALPDKTAARAQLVKANRLITDTFNSFKSIPAKDRQDTPGLLNRLVQTRLNILDLDQNAATNPKRLEPDSKLRESRDFLREARNLTPSRVEGAELDLTELETYISNSRSRGIGDRLPRTPEDFREPDRIEKLVDSLATSEKSLTGVAGQEQVLAQLKLMNMKARFYSPVHQKDALQQLEGNLKSADLVTQQTAAEALNSLSKDFSGLGAGYELMRVAQRNEKVEGLHVDEIVKQYSDQAQAHNKAMSESLGELGPKMNLPSYQRILEHQRDLGEPYLQLTGSLGRLSSKLDDIKAKKGSDEDVKVALANVDMDWINLQCASVAARGVNRPGDGSLQVKTPLSKYKVDLTACLAAKDPKARIMVVHEISKRAINHDLYKNYAWLIGNFAFDVGTIALTGGVGTAISKGVQAGFREAGTALLRRYAMHAVIKAGTRGAAFLTKMVVADLVGQTMGGMKTFVASGLQNGDWDTENLKPDFLKGNFKPGSYALRLMAVQIATRAPWALFGRISTVAMKSANMQRVVTALSKAKPAAVANMGEGYSSISKKIILDPIKGQVNDLASNGLQAELGLANFDGLSKVKSVDNWLSRYRGALLSLPGSKLGDKFSDRLRSMPPKYYGELANAGKCITAHGAVAAAN